MYEHPYLYNIYTFSRISFYVFAYVSVHPRGELVAGFTVSRWQYLRCLFRDVKPNACVDCRHRSLVLLSLFPNLVRRFSFSISVLSRLWNSRSSSPGAFSIAVVATPRPSVQSPRSSSSTGSLSSSPCPLLSSRGVPACLRTPFLYFFSAEL